MELKIDNGKTLNIDNSKGAVRIEKTDSIEINKNSKGYTWSVKAYGDSLLEIAAKIDAYIAYAESISSGKALNEKWKLEKEAVDNVNNVPDAFQQEVSVEELNKEFHLQNSKEEIRFCNF